MYKTIEAVYRQGEIVPLEQIDVKEKSKLLIVVLDDEKKKDTNWKHLRGKYKNKLISVDAYIANKKSEKHLEL